MAERWKLSTISVFLLLFLYFETRSCYTAQEGLEHMIHLPWTLEFWGLQMCTTTSGIFSPFASGLCLSSGMLQKVHASQEEEWGVCSSFPVVLIASLHMLSYSAVCHWFRQVIASLTPNSIVTSFFNPIAGSLALSLCHPETFINAFVQMFSEVVLAHPIEVLHSIFPVSALEREASGSWLLATLVTISNF